MASMRRQLLKDNQDKHEDNNYEFKMREKDDKVPTTDGTNETTKGEKTKEKMILLFFFLALNMFILKVDVKLLGLGII